MSKIHVNNINALTDLKISINRFITEYSTIFQELNLELLRTQQWLEQRKQFWRNELRRCETEVRRAQAALERCQNSNRNGRRNDRNTPPDCSSYIRALAIAEAKLREAQINLETVTRWIRNLDEVSIPYKSKVQSMNRFTDIELKKAQSYLEEQSNALKEYLSITEGNSSTTSLNSGMYNSTKNNRSSDIISGQITVEQFTLPKEFRWVSLSEIDSSKISEDISFNKTSADLMRSGFETLRKDILPAIQSNPMRGSDYFEDIDRASGQEYMGGQQNVYEAFFGLDHIKLERWKGETKYSITNGQHRILTARKLGWSSIPARTKDVTRID